MLHQHKPNFLPERRKVDDILDKTMAEGLKAEMEKSKSDENLAYTESEVNVLELAARVEKLAILLSNGDINLDIEPNPIHQEVLAALGLTNENEHIGLSHFRRIIFENMNVDPSFMCKRVFNAVDMKRQGYLTPKQLISIMTTLLHGSIEAQVDLAIRVYGKPSEKDLLIQESPPSSSYIISRQDAVESIVESLQLSSPRAKHTLTSTSREKAYKVGEDLVLIIFPKLDADKDGVISYDEFLKACVEDNTLIQVFGQFLPKVCSYRPITPLLREKSFLERPRSGLAKPTFDGINYLSHSPTMRTLWGRETNGAVGNSERLQPIPVAKPKTKKVLKKKGK